MRTTLDLPKDLICSAMKAVGAKTKTEVIVMALEELIRRQQLQGLKNFKGKVDIDIDLSSSRGRA